MPERKELKAAAKEQIKGNIGILFACLLVAALIAGTLIGYLFIPAIIVGFCLILIGMTKNIAPQFGDMFRAANLFGRALWLCFIIYVFTTLWSMLLIVPGIIKCISYSMSYFVLAEKPDLTARQALSESKRIMDGNKMSFFVLMLSFIPWMLLCMVTLGIAGIYVAPYISTTIANFYNAIKDKPLEEPQAVPA